jgi:hypothetical protein
MTPVNDSQAVTRKLPVPRLTDIVWLGLLAAALWATRTRLQEQATLLDRADRLEGASPFAYREPIAVGLTFPAVTMVLRGDSLSADSAGMRCARLRGGQSLSLVRRVVLVDASAPSGRGFVCDGSTPARPTELADSIARRLTASLRAHETRLAIVDTAGHVLFSSDGDPLDALGALAKP